VRHDDDEDEDEEPPVRRSAPARTTAFPVPPMDLVVPPSPRLTARAPVTVPAHDGDPDVIDSEDTGETR
jgi:hypothetical protein